MAKKKKFPKYIQDKFTKPQFKVGDKVFYEFLGDKGWGIVTKIQKHNETVSYMVKGRGYTYPCGLQIKEHRSYYAGSIDFEKSKNQRNNESTRSTKTKERIDNKSRKRVSGNVSSSISDTRIRHSSEDDTGNGNADNSNSNKQSTTTTKNVELEDAIDKQKQFLRKFI
jgi:hypothetical protein